MPPSPSGPERVRLPAPSPRLRLVVLAAVLLSQTVVFVHFYPRPPVVIADNIRYERPAWSLAGGGRIALSTADMDDPVVRGWVCARHPEACVGDTTPVAVYPPGYTVFLAGIYLVAGRSLTAVLAAHLVLLWLLFVLFEQVAHRLLGRVGWWFAMAVAFAYPFIARQATLVMSDHVHVVSLFGALAALVLMRPGVARAATFGALLAAATLVRPYSLLAMLTLLAVPSLWSERPMRRREWPTAAAVAFLPFVVWSVRNFYWFGRFIPLSTAGLGATIYTLMLECQHYAVYSADASVLEKALFRFGDPVAWGPNHQMQAVALEWLKAHPLAALRTLLWHVPKVWISLGMEGQQMSLTAIPMALYLGGLWLLGLVGGWIVRRDRRFWAILVTVALYWAFIITGLEARRTLPLRLPMLLLAGAAVDYWVARRQRAASSSS